MKTSSGEKFWVIGIDPGAKGAICFLCSTGQIHFLDMPHTIKDWKHLGKCIRNTNPKAVNIEDVHSLYGMSAKSNFTFGGWVKVINLIVGIALNEWPTQIQPKRWQADLGIKFPPKSSTKDRKQFAAEKALEFRPTVREHIYGPRGGLIDGRVDAFLIAYNLIRRSYNASQ